MLYTFLVGIRLRRSYIYHFRLSNPHHTDIFVFYCFFFQAEDGIRDLYVTGVQTCALPIYAVWASRRNSMPSPRQPQRTAGSSRQEICSKKRLRRSSWRERAKCDQFESLRGLTHFPNRPASERSAIASSSCSKRGLRIRWSYSMK